MCEAAQTSDPGFDTEKLRLHRGQTLFDKPDVAGKSDIGGDAIALLLIAVLTSDPQATVKVSVGIFAEFPSGVSDQIKSAVSENANTQGFKNKNWET